MHNCMLVMLDFFRTSCITFAEKKGDEASQQLDHETKVKASLSSQLLISIHSQPNLLSE